MTDETENLSSADQTRLQRDAGNVIVQDGKTFIGKPNPIKTSSVKYVYTNEDGKQVCSSMRSNSDRICESIFTLENGRCKFHGGQSLAGVAHPRYKDGRKSRKLPARLVERYEEAMADEKLQDMTVDLAVIESRLDDIAGQMDEGGGGLIFKEATEAFKSFQQASADGDTQMMRESLRKLDQTLKKGKTETYLWNEYHKLQDQKRKIILSQAKHMQLTNQMVPVKEVNLLVAALLSAVKENVSDASKLRDIQTQFLRIMKGNTKQLNP
jgi:hypothetical protein